MERCGGSLSMHWKVREDSHTGCKLYTLNYMAFRKTILQRDKKKEGPGLPLWRERTGRGPAILLVQQIILCGTIMKTGDIMHLPKTQGGIPELVSLPITVRKSLRKTNFHEGRFFWVQSLGSLSMVISGSGIVARPGSQETERVQMLVKYALPGNTHNDPLSPTRSYLLVPTTYNVIKIEMHQ